MGDGKVLSVTGAPEVQKQIRGEMEAKALFEQVMSEKFPKQMNNIKSQEGYRHYQSHHSKTAK